MDIKYYAKKNWYKIIYLFVVIIYLFCLQKLNKELLEQHFDAFDLLAYKDYVAVKYFAVALGLFIIGVILIYMEVRCLKEGLEDFGEILVAIITIMVIIVLLVLIIKFINNPILKAILSVVLIIGGGIALTEN